VLIAIADAADQHGELAHPGIAAIARKSLYSERHVRRIISQLEADGWIVATGYRMGGRGMATVWRIPIGKPGPPDVPLSDGKHGHSDVLVSAEKGDISTQKADIQMSPQRPTTVTTSLHDSPSAPRARTRGRDLLWEALADECDLNGNLTKSERGGANKVLKELREVDATPEEVGTRAAEYRRRWPGATLTASALARHWSTLLPADPYAETPVRYV
jgi:hypothetical protein